MTVNQSGLKRAKILLLSLESKRAPNFENLNNAANKLASFGYYCDRAERVAYDSQSEITAAVKEGVERFENVIVLCPQSTGKAVKDFVSSLCGAQFDLSGVLSSGNTHVFVLFFDGENRLQFGDIKQILDKKYGVMYDKCVVRTVGAPARLMNKAVEAAGERFPNGGVSFNIQDDYGDTRIEIVYSSLTPKMTLDDAVREILKILNDYVYALEDITLPEQLYRLLKLRRMKISVAESFTGGGVGKKLVEVAGISEVYAEGLNTYSNQSKMDRLGVSQLTLIQNGAVSAETAFQMAEGLIKAGNCDVAISTTGIAGPKSDNTSKPVGLAYIGVAVGEDIAVYKYNFSGDRERITKAAINEALFRAYKRLK